MEVDTGWCILVPFSFLVEYLVFPMLTYKM